MSKLRDAARQALEALDCIYSPLHVREINKVGAAMVALRAALAEQPAEQEPVALLHDDGYWTAAKTDAGRRLSERLLFAGSPSIAVYTAPQPAKPAEQEPVAWCDQYEDHIDGLRHYSDGGAREIPLYLAPQPAKPAEQEPVASNPPKTLSCCIGQRSRSL